MIILALFNAIPFPADPEARMWAGMAEGLVELALLVWFALDLFL